MKTLLNVLYGRPIEYKLLTQIRKLVIIKEGKLDKGKSPNHVQLCQN
jgi:hypothetical protein